MGPTPPHLRPAFPDASERFPASGEGPRPYGRAVHIGPGVYVGPVFMVLGVLAIVGRRRVAGWLARGPRSRGSAEGTTPETVAAFGGSSVFAGALGLLAGLGLLQWWPL